MMLASPGHPEKKWAPVVHHPSSPTPQKRDCHWDVGYNYLTLLPLPLSLTIYYPPSHVPITLSRSHNEPSNPPSIPLVIDPPNARRLLGTHGNHGDHHEEEDQNGHNGNWQDSCTIVFVHEP